MLFSTPQPVQGRVLQRISLPADQFVARICHITPSLFAVGSRSGTVFILNFTARKIVSHFSVGLGAVYGLTATLDGQHILSFVRLHVFEFTCSGTLLDKDVRMFTLKGAIVWKAKCESGIYSLCATSDGVMVGCSSTEVVLLKLIDGTVALKLAKSSGAVHNVVLPGLNLLVVVRVIVLGPISVRAGSLTE